MWLPLVFLECVTVAIHLVDDTRQRFALDGMCHVQHCVRLVFGNGRHGVGDKAIESGCISCGVEIQLHYQRIHIVTVPERAPDPMWLFERRFPFSANTSGRAGMV